MGKENTKKAKKSAVEPQTIQNSEPVFRFYRNTGKMVAEFEDGRQITVKFNGVEFAAFLLKVTNEIYCKENNREDRYRLDDLGSKLEEFHKILENIDIEWLIAFKRSARFQKESDSTQDARWALSEARRKMRTEFEKNGIVLPENDSIIDKLLPGRNRKITYPINKIVMEDPNPFLGLEMGQFVFRETGVILSKDKTEIKSIPSEVEELDIPDSVIKLEGDVFKKCKRITRIRIPESVTSIDRDVFSGCEKLERIEVSDENPVYKSINGMLLTNENGELIFAPRGIKGDIQIPEDVRSIGENAFKDCTELKSITILSLFFHKIENHTFSGCTGLTSITIPESVTKIGECAFCGCKGLTSISIPEDVRSIGENAFKDCTELKSITILSLFFHKIENHTFSGCTGLTSITIPRSVTEIGEGAFRGCTGLTNITIPDGVTEIGSNVFRDCTGLTSITISKSVTEIEEGAFNGCIELEYINVATENSVYKSIDGVLYNKDGTEVIHVPEGFKGPLYIRENVTDIRNDAFNGCTRLVGIEVANENPIWKSENGMLFNNERTVLILVSKGIKGELDIPKGVIKIGSRAFEGCTGLTSITIPDSIEEIGALAFSGCEKLTKIILPESVTEIKEFTFAGCARLTNIIIPDSIKEIDGAAFFDCTGLTSVIIPKGVNRIGMGAFMRCTGLKHIIIQDGVTEFGWLAFNECTSLKSITLPKSVKEIFNFLGSAFGGCTQLERIEVVAENSVYKSIGGVLYNKDGTEIIRVPEGFKGSFHIPEGVTSIGFYAFDGCTEVTSITIPESLVGIWIGWGLEHCSGLECIEVEDGNPVYKSINGMLLNNAGTVLISVPAGIKGKLQIPEGVTEIGWHAFDGCTGLVSITIPESVTKIEGTPFNGCFSLESIYFNGDKPIIENIFRDTSATVYYRKETKGWKKTFGGLPTQEMP